MLALKTATNSIRPLITATKAPNNARGLIQSVLYGSEKAKEEGAVETLQHSKIVGRGKYIHAFETHRVRPEVVEQYQEAAAKYYTGLASDASLSVKLTGGWETVVGALDTYVHVLEYENYKGYDHSAALIRQSKEHTSNFQALLPFIQNRNLQLCQEFAFWASSPPHQKGGIFELRTYQLQAGTLLEWESAWRKGIEARRKFAAPVGAWFSQVGRLHQVHHMWQFESLESRKATREKSWTVEGWANTVDSTAKLTQMMDSSILKPLPYSPLR